MAILGYEPTIRCALANAPYFPLDDKELAVSTDPIPLDEWCSYFVKFYDDIPEFFDKAPYRDRSNQWKFPGNTFLINFKNSVGLTRIESLCLWIKNQKIGEEAFYTLLEFISDHYANLISDWNTATGYAHRQDIAGRNIAYIEFLLLKKHLLSTEQSLESLVTAILSDPHRRLCREIRYQPIEKVVAPDPLLIMIGLSKPGNTVELRCGHPLLETALGRALVGNAAGKCLYLQQVFEERKYHSYDTPENRFIKHVLSDIQERLKQLQNVLGGSVNYLHPTLDRDLAALQTQAQGSLEDPLWREVEFMRLVPSSSPVLQRKEGYQQLFGLYSLLQLLTRFDLPCFDFSHLLETKNTATLFEYWCFFLIKDILDKEFGKPRHCQLVNNGQRNQTLIDGISLEYENGLSFSFNRSYSSSNGLASLSMPISGYEWGDSYSHTLYPDFSLHYQERILILDAKYKGEREGFYGETGSGIIESWKQEDIIKMHAYRDAIASAVGAFILYPGCKTVFYPSFNATRCCQGVGAIALRPGLNAQPEGTGCQMLQALIRDFTSLENKTTLLTSYITAAMRRARYEILPENEGYFGTIDMLPGVWANAASLEVCRDQLQEVLEEWIVLGLRMEHDLPEIDGIQLGIQEAA